MPQQTTPISRRGFLAGAAGLSFAVCVGPQGAWLAPAARADEGPAAIGAWVRIATDGTVTIVTPAAEMGQGSMTGVPVALAEELDADWTNVVLEMAPADADTYGYSRGRGQKSMRISGSRAVRSYFDDMRLAGAQVRKLLLQAAAEELGVEPPSLTTEPGVVVHEASGRRMTYGEIAAVASVPDPLPTVSRDELKNPSEFRLIGTPVARHDIPAKVDGSALFAIDVNLPGMAYATTLHAPQQLAEPESFNRDKLRRMPGVIDVVAVKHGVVVVAESFEEALSARRALNVRWSSGAPSAGYDSEAAIDGVYATLAGNPANAIVADAAGDVAAALVDADRVYRAEFRSDYGYHAQMEPLNAVARWNASLDRVEIWDGTQAPDDARALVASELGLDVDRVVHHQLYLGGGFGRRTISDYAVEAAIAARHTRRPVKLVWTREEDLAYAMFRPQALQQLEVALAKDGRVAAWRHCVVGDGDRLTYSGINLDEYYAIPNRAIEYCGIAHGIRLKHWRAVAHPFNLFAIEGLVDEMASTAGVDPFDFRRENLQATARARDVLDAVRKLSHWDAPRPQGRALGLALSERSGSLAAGVVEASLDREQHRIRVHKVWMAVDGGIIVQPDMARANIESGIVYGLSSVLRERATIRDGRVVQSNFHDYEILRMSEAPEEIHVEFLRRETPPTGLGEIGNPFVAAAVANAFHALTGKRLYHMPFTPERIRRALA